MEEVLYQILIIFKKGCDSTGGLGLMYILIECGVR